MKISQLSALAQFLRRDAVLLSVLSLGPLIAGCVSAVDDSKALGFNGAPSAGAGESGADADGTDQGAEATGNSPAASEVAASPSPTIARSAENAPSKPDESPGRSDKSGPIIASGRTTIAAYAGATVDAVSETSTPAEGPGEHANSTLFTSLFAQSKARTPIANAEKGKSRRVLLQRDGPPIPAAEGSALPGVKSVSSLFEIGQKASADYDADILEEAGGTDEGSYQVASLTGIARLAPNGLLVQRPDVQTDCFQPQLVSILHAVEARFHTKVVVTSGYRSPSHNRAVNGAKRSMHMSCKAADIQVPGADKFAVATFVRSLPGRGGVGTYCHTTAVHVDIGPERDWNWACRRRVG